MFHIFVNSSTQRAPKGSAEQPFPAHFQSPGRRKIWSLYYLPHHHHFVFSLNRHCIFTSALYIFEFEHFRTCFFSMFHSFAIFPSQCATKDSAEQSSYTYLVAWPAHNLLIALPASPPTILFHFQHTIAFQPVHLFYLYTFCSLIVQFDYA